jgi:flagellar motor switch/type III secretory pathway protein FliN
VALGGAEGVARIELPPAVLPAAPRPGRVPPSRVSPLLQIELARTTLDGAALAAAGPGDALVFEGCPAPPSSAPWPVAVRFGACLLPATLHPDGSLRRQGPLTGHESEVPMAPPEITDTQLIAALSEDAARALAAAPVEIVAELGRITVRGDELVGLIEGGVLTLGGRRPAHVQLRVGPRLWATGELVAIDDELAVRITELVR